MGAIDIATMQLLNGCCASIVIQYLLATTGITIGYMLCFLAALNYRYRIVCLPETNPKTPKTLKTYNLQLETLSVSPCVSV